MDDNNAYDARHDHGSKHTSSADHFPQPTISPSRLSSVSSYDNHDGDLTKHVHPPAPDMDEASDTRRRAPLMNHSQGSTAHKHEDKSSPKRYLKAEASPNPAMHADNAHGSDLSSASMSDDVELERFASDNEPSDNEDTGLTKNALGRRRKRRRKHHRVDESVMGTRDITEQERQAADKSVLKALLINALLIAAWYAFSLSISIYNKWMFSPKYLDFHFPLFTTCMHMLVQFTLASLVLYFVPRLRPRVDSITNPHNHDSAQEPRTDTAKPLMTRLFYLTRIGPCGVATGLDIGLGNMSLKFISLTFFTMCKSSALAFVLMFAFLFRLEQPSWKLVLIIATMTVGVIMMVAGETAFDALGFALIISSSFFSGFRWALTQILLLRNPATSNPFSSIFFLAPVMFVSLAIIAIPVERFGQLEVGLRILAEKKGTFQTVVILLLPGLLAFLMTASEFALLKRTSVVTLSICGIFKEVVTISAAGIVFHDPLTPINISGLLVTIASIATYNYIKITKMRKMAELDAAKSAAADGEAAEPMLHEPDLDEGSHAAEPPLYESGPNSPTKGTA
ncbi:MAG: hypothetical protein Q9191_001785 [Dirinaria sp. TL-2023a]